MACRLSGVPLPVFASQGRGAVAAFTSAKPTGKAVKAAMVTFREFTQCVTPVEIDRTNGHCPIAHHLHTRRADILGALMVP
jgi:hypothetical protein